MLVGDDSIAPQNSGYITVRERAADHQVRTVAELCYKIEVRLPKQLSGGQSSGTGRAINVIPSF